MTNKNLIDLEAMSVEQIAKIVKKARKIMQSPADYRHACDGKILATLFYEPSTRTQMSFQTAMLKLGGRTIGFDNPLNSSVAKGESLKDTISVISGYADIIAIRHPVEGTAMAASLYSEVPLINCGDGGHLHPTQTLTDIVTLSCEKGRLDHMKIGVCGDLLNGRTVHSLIKTRAKYEGNSFVLISTEELGVPLYIIDIREKNGCAYEISHNLADAVVDLDVLYMTRIQRERFKSEEEYQAQKDYYTREAGKAQENVQGSLSANTGGYSNSYAQSAGQRAYGQYMDELASKIPALRESARQDWNTQQEQTLSQISMLKGFDDSAYARFRDKVSDNYDFMTYYENKYGTQRGLDMSAFQQELANWQTRMSAAQNNLSSIRQLAESQYEHNTVGADTQASLNQSRAQTDAYYNYLYSRIK